MVTFEIHEPICITPENFSGFISLMQHTQEGILKTQEIADFMINNNGARMTPIKTEKPCLIPHPSIQNAYTRIIMFSAPPREAGGLERYAVLFIDAIPKGSEWELLPRQWLFGPDLQAVLPYKMSCCTGLSAAAIFKQGGVMHSALLEDAQTVKSEFRDLFGINRSDQNTGICFDPTGETIEQWRRLVTGTNLVQNRIPPVPGDLPAFKKA